MTMVTFPMVNIIYFNTREICIKAINGNMTYNVEEIIVNNSSLSTLRDNVQMNVDIINAYFNLD